MAKRTRHEQTEIPGIEQEKVAPVEDAAQEYAEERDARLAQAKLESEAKRKLIELLHKHEGEIKWGRDKEGNRIYECGDMLITLETPKENVKVKIGDEAVAE